MPKIQLTVGLIYANILKLSRSEPSRHTVMIGMARYSKSLEGMA